MTMDLPAVEVRFIGEPKVFIQFGHNNSWSLRRK